MEFSIAKSIQRLRPKVIKHSRPSLSATPAQNIVSPGISCNLRHTNYIVLLPGHPNAHQETKKVQEDDTEVKFYYFCN